MPKGRRSTTYCTMANHDRYRVNGLTFMPVILKPILLFSLLFVLSKCQKILSTSTTPTIYNWFTMAVDYVVSAQPKFVAPFSAFSTAMCTTTLTLFVSIKSCTISLHSGKFIKSKLHHSFVWKQSSFTLFCFLPSVVICLVALINSTLWSSRVSPSLCCVSFMLLWV
jgi:hypothetical protein